MYGIKDTRTRPEERRERNLSTKLQTDPLTSEGNEDGFCGIWTGGYQWWQTIKQECLNPTSMPPTTNSEYSDMETPSTALSATSRTKSETPPFFDSIYVN